MIDPMADTTEKERFDAAMRQVLTVTKEELNRRLAAEPHPPRIGKKRGPKPKALQVLEKLGQSDAESQS